MAEKTLINTQRDADTIELDEDNENVEPGYYGRDYHDDRSWEDLQEDEFGNLQSIADASEHAARRRRMLLSQVGARVRRGMIRYLQLIVDLSKASGLTDMRPVRSAVIFHAVSKFIRAFFDANPLSQLGIIVLRNGLAERITELSSSPEMHILKLKNSLDTAGATSIQNGLDLAVESLRHIPPYGYRETLLVLSALSTCDPGNVMDSIKACKAAKVRISVIGLSAEMHICRVAANETGGVYDVSTSESNLEEILVGHSAPPPAAPGSTGVSLVRMGFPAKSSAAPGAASFAGFDCNLQSGSYICPRCKARVTELPAECHVCGLTLVLSSQLARSYHHLFPLKPFIEVVFDDAALQASSMAKDIAGTTSVLLPEVQGKLLCCYGCCTVLEKQPVAVSNKRNASQHSIAVVTTPMVVQCPDCRHVYCLDCDVYIHEQLHSCPGCECLPVAPLDQKK